MPIVCGVRFRETGKVYFFSPGDLSIEQDEYVIVETSRGDELGQVIQAPHSVDASEVVGELKPVLRIATTIDLLEAEKHRQKEDGAVTICQEQVERYGLKMKIVSAEYSYDGSRLTFFFTADKRVDFRALVRDLARTFKTRIELRQIGVRDEAKMVGGLGPCGRSLCCSTWLTQFSPVSIRMAKQQNLPLSPMEISGLCGRLLCCLTYEDDYYREIKGRFPKVGRTIDSPYGPAKVTRVCVLKEAVTLLLEDGTKVDLTAGQLSGEESLPARDVNGTHFEGLDSTLDRTVENRSGDGRGSRAGSAPQDRAQARGRSMHPRAGQPTERGDNGQEPAQGKPDVGQDHREQRRSSPKGRSGSRSRRRRDSRSNGER